MVQAIATRDPLDVHIGGRMKALRSLRRLSLERIGEQVGVSYQQIRKYELGDNRISAGMLYRVSTILDVEIGYFFQGLQDAPPACDGNGVSVETVGELLRSLNDERIQTILHDLLRALGEQKVG